MQQIINSSKITVNTLFYLRNSLKDWLELRLIEIEIRIFLMQFKKNVLLFLCCLTFLHLLNLWSTVFMSFKSVKYINADCIKIWLYQIFYTVHSGECYSWSAEVHISNSLAVLSCFSVTPLQEVMLLTICLLVGAPVALISSAYAFLAQKLAVCDKTDILQTNKIICHHNY